MRHDKTTIIISFLASFCSGQIFAMQSMNDEHMSNVTAQDGITVQLFSSGVTINKILMHDNDGLQSINGDAHGIANASAGAIIVNQLALIPQDINRALLDITIDTEGGAGLSNTEAMLNVAVKLAATNIAVDSVAVGTSGAEITNINSHAGARRGASNETKIVDGFTLKLGQMTFNTQFGRQEQGYLMKVYGTIEDGIRISNLNVLTDGGSQYLIGMGEIAITDSGGASDLTFNGVGVNVIPSGILITPSTGKTVDVAMKDFTLGGQTATPANAIGAMYMSGLVLGGNTITISGH